MGGNTLSPARFFPLFLLLGVVLLAGVNNGCMLDRGSTPGGNGSGPTPGVETVQGLRANSNETAQPESSRAELKDGFSPKPERSPSMLDANVSPAEGPETKELPTPPCANTGRSDVTCEQRDVGRFRLFSVGQGGAAYPSDRGAATVEQVLEKGLALVGASPVHLAFRGTAQANSVRCEWRGIARTPDQREAAIRHWLGLDEDTALPSPSEAEKQFMSYVNQMDPHFRDTMEANFKALARGGASTEYMFLTCFADYTVSEYLLGPSVSGTTTLTIAYDKVGEGRSYDLYRRSHEGGRFGDQPLKTKGMYQVTLEQVVQDTESLLDGIVEGYESVVFLAPMGAHNTIATQAWQAVAQWDLQTDDGSIVNAVRYGVDANDPEYTQTLANLKTRITTAAAADAFANDRIANVSGLNNYYREIGAYGDITPDDGETATFTPSQPPPVYSCASGAAVTNPGANRGLVHDCEALLAAKATLSGTATLNWATSAAVTGWDGVTAGGAPSRVTGLALSGKTLTGTIPPDLGTLFELTTLDLSGNQLTGEISSELGWLFNLEELRLSGNQLTGCVPVALKDVATNDLSSLNLLYCQPPAPENLSAGTPGETSVSLSWNAVSNTSKYRVEHRLYGTSDWSTDDDAITGASHMADELACDSEYQFRVSAYGSGVTYAAAWSEASAVVSGTTTECVSPVFDAASYAFEVVEDAEAGVVVGTVSAPDPNDDAVTYAITGGDEGGKFAIGSGTGEITVAGALDHAVTPSYSLTVEARDGAGNTGTATVDVAVTDVLELPPPPESLSVSLSEGVFTITWDPAPGANNYAIQYRIPGVQEDFADLPFTQNTSLTYGRDDGLQCEKTYEFRALAYGDGVGYLAVWGQPSAPVVATAGSCNLPPEFTSATYMFPVSEEVAIGHSVGFVSATDPDQDDTVTYSITGGNEDGKFAVNAITGEVTVAGALDYEATVDYTLTVEAGDGNGGTDTADVYITVTDVAENAPPTPTGLEATLSEGVFTITWGSMNGVTEYRVEYRTGGADGTWTEVETTASASSSLTPEGGPLCGTTYEFRVQSYGDGVQYSAMWGAFSDPASVETEACNQPPEFGNDSYSFSVAENSGEGASVGVVSATDPDQEDTVTYSITAGNQDGKFAVNGNTGEITVAGALDYETDSSYTLTVEADDGNGGTDTATVEINVTDVAEDPPPAPADFRVSLTGETFTLTWAAVSGAAQYEVDHRVAGSGWTSLDPTTETTQTYSPEGGPACETTYEFRVRARGDGTAHAARWGSYSAEEPVTTGSCNLAPEFSSPSYSFTIPDDATTVGSVSATDPDDGDAPSYSITVGNEDSGFAINRITGEITVPGTLDYASVSSYLLTVEADDGNGGTAEAEVAITLTLAECSNGTAVPQPDTWTGLVRDCSILLTARDTLAGSGSLNWSAGAPMSQWQGVGLELRPVMRVRLLLLTGLGLTGNIPASLGGLDDLRRLDLDDNDLTGPVPAELGNLTKLDQLYLFNNRLTGAIPPELGKLTLLRYLFLYDNQLTGGIPAELGNLTNLRQILLDGNGLTGAIPARFGEMTNLEQLWARDNQLTGQIPAVLADLSSLTDLYLEGNGFTGCIPSGLRDVDNHDLDTLELDDCG